jgi:hypothetical protein
MFREFFAIDVLISSNSHVRQLFNDFSIRS